MPTGSEIIPVEADYRIIEEPVIGPIAGLFDIFFKGLGTILKTSAKGAGGYLDAITPEREQKQLVEYWWFPFVLLGLIAALIVYLRKD